MNRLYALTSNMLNSIPLPSLRERGRGWGFWGLCALSLAASLTASAQRSTINLKTWQFSRDSVNYNPSCRIALDWQGILQDYRQLEALAQDSCTGV